ncbi:inorganic pyrophosphatase [Myxococcus sp. MISCRS1]|jgi:inorganic pyrophosphatase|uniref:inorganic pyrophosphatase n=1 Tax=Myxococcus TaxID=32 RepID=UPI001CC16947|nr:MULTISPECIES: inorganic pyrophosphatase [Myxococcus]BDT36637.1 inorganic pyrophosphatase [Myxococcus sp. MH1]MBZ4394820.1 inorganic pyrophosphatase [Myxococcus sp. AS-1-15]MBZ4406601.1 inorganic pyrophosphatase [Myxococcus sp. XM-1-1-1]MCP3057956.1 inorganic pyrophosphatase [Myxococcus guangdongensis]MCY1001791.1 inorganic pyrophosphatase [Myxococcus sp. MISCRS1]
MKKPAPQKSFASHPWHGITPGNDAPEVVTAYIEIVPTDAVKYELDKESGILMLDRPQRFSSQCPTLYGFIPQTFCDELVAKRCAERTGMRDIKGDGDPIDICVLTEKVVSNGNLLVRAVPVGGFRMVDGDEADDKIIAVLESDLVYGELQHIAQLPRPLLDRLKHYFLTYKQIPGEGKRSVEIAEVYDRPEALEVIRRSMKDYDRVYGNAPTTPVRSRARRPVARKSRAS